MHEPTPPLRALPPRHSRRIATALVALTVTTAPACASASQQPAAGDAASHTTQAFSTATAQSSASAHPAGTSAASPGVIATPPTPNTLPCLHGTTTLTLHADGTDPTQICLHQGTELTLTLPTMSIGPWQTPTLTDTRVVTATTTRDATHTTLRLTAAATGTSQISTQTNPGAAAGAPTQTWTATLTVIP